MILNLTQHAATKDQVDQFVVDLNDEDKIEIVQLLTFDELPTHQIIKEKAKAIAALAATYQLDKALIGGAPYLMAELEHQLKRKCITPVYAFSQRVSVEKTDEDGNVTKTNVFKHIGFVDAI